MSYVVKENFEENIGMDESKIGVILRLCRIVMNWRIDIRKRRNRIVDVSFLCVVKTQRRWSNKIYKTELTKTRYNNQVLGKYRVDPQRAGLTLIAELTWSNLGLKEVLNKRKKDVRYGNDINRVNKKF